MECPGDHFCCDFGTACTRDAVGNAICFESVCFDSTCANSTLSIPSPARTFSSTPLDTNTGHVVTNPGNSPTVVVSIVNINNNSNTVNNNAALPQVTTALVLMVVVPLLSALLLVGPLTFSHKIIPDPIRHPALGFCSRAPESFQCISRQPDSSSGPLSRLCVRSLCRDLGYKFGVPCASLNACTPRHSESYARSFTWQCDKVSTPCV